MPLYDFACGCGEVEKDVFLFKWDDIVRCKKCKKPMTKLVTIRVKAKVFPAEGVFLEHVSAKGKRFFSEKEMRDYAKEHNLELGYLL